MTMTIMDETGRADLISLCKSIQFVSIYFFCNFRFRLVQSQTHTHTPLYRTLNRERERENIDQSKLMITPPKPVVVVLYRNLIPSLLI